MKLFKIALNISLLTFLSRIFGFLRDILLAFKVGAGANSDILFIALKIPNLFRRIFAEGAFSQAFIPSFCALLVNKSQKIALDFANNVIYYFLISLFLLVVIIEIFMPQFIYIFAYGYRDNAEVITLSRIAFPYIIFISAVTVINAVLNSLKIFIIGSLMPIIYNLCIILSIFLLIGLDTKIAVIYGVVFSGILQLTLIYFYARKRNIILVPTKSKKSSKELKKLVKKLMPGVFSASIIQLNSWVDIMIASFIPGAVSYLYYSDRIIQLPLALIAIAITTAILPFLSKNISKKQYKEANKIFFNSIELSCFFALPAMIGLFSLNEQIIMTIYGYGEFNISAIKATSDILAIFALALPAFVLSKILLTCFYARENFNSPLKISLFTLFLNLVLNIILVQYFSYLGIALATLISAWINVFILTILIRKNNYANLDYFSPRKFTKIILAASCFFFTVNIFSYYIPSFIDLGLLDKYFYLFITIIANIIIYFVLSVIFKLYNFREIKTVIFCKN